MDFSTIILDKPLQDPGKWVSDPVSGSAVFPDMLYECVKRGWPAKCTNEELSPLFDMLLNLIVSKTLKFYMIIAGKPLQDPGT